MKKPFILIIFNVVSGLNAMNPGHVVSDDPLIPRAQDVVLLNLLNRRDFEGASTWINAGVRLSRLMVSEAEKSNDLFYMALAKSHPHTLNQLIKNGLIGSAQIQREFNQALEALTAPSSNVVNYAAGAILTILKSTGREWVNVNSMIEFRFDRYSLKKPVPLLIVATVERRMNELARGLICAGADVNAQDVVFKRTPLIHALIGEDYNLVNFLLDHSAIPLELDREDTDQKTALFYSVECHEAERNSSKMHQITQKLIAKGASLNVKDSLRHTALMQALFFGNKTAALMLIEAGADLLQERNSQTALDIARDGTCHPEMATLAPFIEEKMNLQLEQKKREQNK